MIVAREAFTFCLQGLAVLQQPAGAGEYP
jgi:hypothetical protein